MKTLTVKELKNGNFALVGEFNRNLWKSNDYGNHKAGAHLLAAAPDMLAALQYVVDYHREHDSGEGELFGLDYVTTCIAAIRKAQSGGAK